MLVEQAHKEKIPVSDILQNYIAEPELKAYCQETIAGEGALKKQWQEEAAADVQAVPALAAKLDATINEIAVAYPDSNQSRVEAAREVISRARGGSNPWYVSKPDVATSLASLKASESELEAYKTELAAAKVAQEGKAGSGGPEQPIGEKQEPELGESEKQSGQGSQPDLTNKLKGNKPAVTPPDGGGPDAANPSFIQGHKWLLGSGLVLVTGVMLLALWKKFSQKKASEKKAQAHLS